MIKPIDLKKSKMEQDFYYTELEKKDIEIARLKAQVNYHDKLFSKLPTGLVLRRLDKTIIDCNEAYANIVGRTKEDILKSLYNSITPLKYKDVDNEQIELVTNTGSFGPYEKEYIHSDGHLVPVRLRGMILKISGINCLWASVEDISDLRENEEKILENEKKYQSLFEEIDSAILVIEDNKFVECNNAVVKMLGYKSKEELLQTHPSELSPEKQPDGKLSYEKAEEMMNLALEHGTHHFEWVHTRANGENFPVEVWLSIVNYNNKKIIHTVWRDLTIKKRNEEYLRKLEKAFEYAPVSIYITDIDYNIEYINPFFKELTGFSEKDVIGKNAHLFRTHKHPQSFYEHLENAIFNNKVWKSEILSKKKSGEEFWASIAISPILDENKNISHFLVIKEDITEKKKAREELVELNTKLRRSERKGIKEAKNLSLLNSKLEKSENELIQLNKEQERLLSIIAHDLRGPFAGFLSLTQFLKDEHDKLKEKDILKLANSLNSAANNTFKLLENLLAWTQSKDKHQFICQEILDLGEMVDEIINLFSEMANNKGVTLSKSINTSNFVYADKHMLNTILRNLVSNALKFTKDGGRIDISSLIYNKDFLEIIVRDTGVGISEDDCMKIFKIDQKHTTLGTNKEKGTGLGLLLCKEFTEKHGGEIWVDSTVGIGSEFTFTIPISK